MPRYFGNETYNGDQGAVKWYNGACAVAEDDAAAIAFLGAIHGITEDTNKHELTVLDKLTREQINGISSYLGVALDSTDTKAEVIRKIEGAISTEFLGVLTVDSVAHDSKDGFTVVTITESLTGTNVHKYKVHATEAPAPLYGDEADSTWLPLTSGATDGLELTTGHKITVVECTAAGFIVRRGNDTIASKTEGAA